MTCHRTRTRLTNGRSATAVLLVALACWLLIPMQSGVAQQDTQGTVPARGGSDAVDSAAPTLPLPLRDRAGRPLRAIGIYLSQIVDLVPAEFRAVSIDELRKAIGNDSERFSDAQQARLISGFYDIRLDDQLLVSERSKIVVEHSPRLEVRRKLGRVNLAIGDSAGGFRTMLSPAITKVPRLEIDHEGELIAVVPKTDNPAAPPADLADAVDLSGRAEPGSDEAGLDGWRQSEIRFGWTLTSQSLGTVKKFDLRLPRTSQTRLVISTPSDIELESRQGVLVERPGPPPDADVQTRTGDIRWYVLEAGGLNRLEIFARRRAETDFNQPLFVRRESKQYDVDLSGVSWIHRMTVQLPRHRNRIRLRSPLGTVTAVRVNSVEATYQVLRRTDGQSLIDVDLPGGIAGDRYALSSNGSGDSQPTEPAIELVTLTVEGTANWDLSDGICELPSVTPLEPNVMWTEVSTQAIVSVLEPLDVVQWDLPPTWRQSIQTPTRAGETLLIAEGAPPGGPHADPVWSRLKLVEKEERYIDAVWTRLRVQQTPSMVVRSSSRIRCRLLQNHQSPFRMVFNPDWTIDSVTIIGSGRRITLSPGANELVIWPTPSESAQATFEIEVNAQQTLPRNRNRLAMAATWIVRPEQHVGLHVISIQPPPLRRWDGNSVLLHGRFEASLLDEESLAFFQPTSETLLIQSSIGEIPAVTLEPVDDSFGVALRHVIESEGSDISETIIVRAETAQPISELSVLTGKARQSEFSWSLRRTDQSATISLPSSSVQRMPADPLGTYVISLEGRDLRQYELVGRRFFSTGDELTLVLPSVRRTRSSQTAEVVIDEHWEVTSIPPNVQLVPGAESSETFTSLGTDSPGLGPRTQYLRYDPVDRPEVQLRRSRRDSAACLIWDQRFEVMANSRSEDLFHLFAEVSTLKPIHVSYDDELEIVSVSRNGVIHAPERAGAGEFWLSPDRQTDHVSVLLRRRHSSRDWLRRCLIPRIELEGEVVRNQVVYETGAETLLLYQSYSSHTNDSVDGLQTAELWMVPSDIAMGLGWLAAGILFCLAWSIARSFSLGVHSLFVSIVLAISAAIIWWPWQTAILGWIAVPIVSAALLHVVTTQRQSRRSQGTPPQSAVRSDDTRSQRLSNDPSVDFSASIPHSTVLLAILLGLAVSNALRAQEPSIEPSQRESLDPDSTAGNDSRSPIELLVPMNQRHVPVGDKVYMSSADYESIRSVVDPDRPVDARFQSAEYHVVLTPPRDASASIDAEIQADYQIQLVRESTRVQLPVRAETVRRIELVSEGDTQIVRFTVNERGMVTATIPSSRQILLRLTYLPSVLAIDTDSTTDSEVSIAADQTESSQADPSNPAEASTLAGALTAGGDAPTASATLIRLGIPAIHSAKLIVEAPREILIESLGEPLGRSVFRPELGRYEADLGPIRELAIRCRPGKRPGQSTQQAPRRAYRISAGIESTIVECEIQPEEKLSEGDTIQLTILGGVAPTLTSSGWSIANTDPVDNAERSGNGNSTATLTNGIYRFKKQSAEDGPIRLLWRLRSVLNDPTSTDDSKTMPIPEVFVSASLRAAPALFAIESAASIRVAELAKGSQPASEEDFFAAWRGYPGKIQRAFVIRDAFPSFVLLQDKYPSPTVSLEHRLHVAETKMELRLKAEIVDLRPSIRRLQVLIPNRFRVINCLVNDEPLTSLTPRTAFVGTSQMELALGDNRVNGTTTIELVGETQVPIRGQSELPQFSITCDGEVQETYRITRDRSLEVSLVEPSSETGQGQEDALPSDDASAAAGSWTKADLTPADLLAGRIPVAYTDVRGDHLDATRILVGRRPAGSVFTCDQTTRMRYSDGQWFCDTLLELPAGKVPDYVDLQLPTRWATDLSVFGSTIWAKRESSDLTVTVVRISLMNVGVTSPADEQGIRRVQITGSLNNRDQVRVSVPVVSVLGGKARNFVIAVPGQLTTESIQWRVQSVRLLKADNQVFQAFINQVESPERYTLYTTTDRNWSIQLEPLSQATINPVALSCDARVYMNGRRALVYQRFDILPETRSEVEVALPAGAVCVGIWSAGREVDLQGLRSLLTGATSGAETGTQKNASPEAASSKAPAKVRVPLSYSRLPQALELLVEVPIVDRRTTAYLSELVAVPTREVWVAYYEIPNGDQSRRLSPEQAGQPETDRAIELKRLASERAFSLAQSVVTAIDRSRDMLAERSDEEIKRWLFPWITHYRSIASRNGHQFQLSDIGSQATNGAAQPETETDVDAIWQSYDQRLIQLVGRFLQTDPQMPPPLFERDRFSTYELVDIKRLDAFTEGPALVQSFTQRKSLQELLVNAITLLTFGLAIILIWPFRGRFRGWIHEPAMWLFMIGVVALFLAPVPVAIAIMVVAVTVPLINRMKAKATSLGA